jgi:hypothetical protein
MSLKRWCQEVVLLLHGLEFTELNADFVQAVSQQIEIIGGHYSYIARLQLLENEQTITHNKEQHHLKNRSVF